MSSLTVPVLSIVTGEGGSGGALALGVANEVWIDGEFHIFYTFTRRFCIDTVEGF